MEGNKTNVYIPHRNYYEEVLAEHWRYSWKSVLIPKTSYSRKHLLDIKQCNLKIIHPVKNFHSTFPSYSYVIESQEGTLLYTGDMRVKSILRVFSQEPIANEIFSQLYGKEDYDFIRYISERFQEIDLLIIEGTNFGRPLTPLQPEEFVNLISKLMVAHPSIVSLHTLDLESFIAVALIAYIKRLPVTIYSTRIVRFLCHTLDARILHELNISYTGRKTLPTIDLEYISPNEALKEFSTHKRIIVTDYETVDIARVLMEYKVNRPILAILVTSEPLNEEYGIEIEKQIEWLRLAGVQPYRIRVSGHYYPHEIVELKNNLKFKKVIPIHTERPELVRKVL